MEYTLTTPCSECPFLKKNAKSYGLRKLRMFARGEFPCHRTAVLNEEESIYEIGPKSLHCAGMLIFLEKRDESTQMMRICERLRLYDRTKLNMKAPVI
jgi:hypothetical protein